MSNKLKQCQCRMCSDSLSTLSTPIRDTLIWAVVPILGAVLLVVVLSMVVP
jgi:hypothetical protein